MHSHFKKRGLCLFYLSLSLSHTHTHDYTFSLPPSICSATSVGVKNGHRLGFWCAVPAALVGIVAGNRSGIYRYLGYTDNGNPALYPGYKEDNTPYFMKHEVSERHAPAKQFR